ncbi:hypothetical protein [Nocardia sp. NPDC047654]|uniref:hypothetical protein n=1 Tax=Nocardia sp. NPDC047654 TaxID=3364314 RepID=UPI003721B4E4
MDIAMTAMLVAALTAAGPGRRLIRHDRRALKHRNRERPRRHVAAGSARRPPGAVWIDR